MKVLSNIGYYQPGATAYVLYAFLDSSNRVGAAYKAAAGSTYTYLQAAVLADSINQGKAGVQSNINIGGFLNEATPAGVTNGTFTADNEPTSALPSAYTGQAYGSLVGDDLPIGYGFANSVAGGDAGTAAPAAGLTGSIDSFITDLTSFNLAGLSRNPLAWILLAVLAWRMGWINPFLPKSLKTKKGKK